MSVLAPPNPRLPMPEVDETRRSWCRACRGAMLLPDVECLRLYEQGNRTCPEESHSMARAVRAALDFAARLVPIR